MSRSGYTLPVFAVAAAKAALMRLITPAQYHEASPLPIGLDLPTESVTIPIEQIVPLDDHQAIAIAHSDPGDNLDLTRNTPIWAWVDLQPRGDAILTLRAGEGLGKTEQGEPAIYRFARSLFETNLLPFIPAHQSLTVTIIFPEGRALAERTSNAAFGIVEGLALLGTSGISQPLSAEAHLAELRTAIQEQIQVQPHLVFCVGSHGMAIAERLGYPKTAIAQTGNWIGALLVDAALHEAKSVLLLGYQGKLIKLAGGIFNTSSHLADAKLEIISAAIAQTGGSLATIQAVLQAQTADAAYQYLQSLNLALPVFQYLAETISAKAQNYVRKYANRSLPIGTILFDRQGQIIAQDNLAADRI